MTNRTKSKTLITSLIVGFLLAGCSTVPISNSGYQQSTGDTELDELEVLGIRASISNNESLAGEQLSSTITLPNQINVLLLQSGARFPDAALVSSMSSYWKVSTLSGVRYHYEGHDINQTLRNAAASGGYDMVVVYWGVLETAEQNLHSKSFSWVPVVGWSLPDENVKMRATLRFAVINAKSGQWRTFQPESVEMEYLSAIISRDSKHQNKEIELKQKIYSAAVDQLRERFSQ